MQATSNLILNTDSYKASHWRQYPPGVEATFFYVESRGGAYQPLVFFGLQAILKERFSRPVTADDVADAREFFRDHGLPFNEAGWQWIVQARGGRLPLRIRALPEGTVAPARRALVTIESTHPAAYWLPSYVETALLRLWYPVTVATISWHVRQTIRGYLERTCDDPAGALDFRLHDFGARGASSLETAALGGMAHLVNFRGSDTISGVLAAREYYGAPMAGLSIPAAEHSTITAWGPEREAEAYRNMLDAYAAPGRMLAVVSDSFDYFHAVREHWGRALRDEVIRSGATLVIRPDSGDPVEVVAETLRLLAADFGSVANAKGYRVLQHVRVIQGDGMTPGSIAAVMERITQDGFSAENVTFGMGGGLLQRCNRDTLQFAMKCSAARIDGRWIDIFKRPSTDAGKNSQPGRLVTLQNQATGELRTVAVPSYYDDPLLMTPEDGWRHALEDVWLDGELLRDQSFDDVRSRASG